MKYAYLLSLLLLATGLTGCVGGDWSVNITHTGTTTAADGEGDCFTLTDGEECHWVSISVEVTGAEDFTSNMFYWEAVGSSGGIYSAPMVDGPDACAAGATCNFILEFDVSAGDTLVTLNYDDIWNSASTSL